MARNVAQLLKAVCWGLIRPRPNPLLERTQPWWAVTLLSLAVVVVLSTPFCIPMVYCQTNIYYLVATEEVEPGEYRTLSLPVAVGQACLVMIGPYLVWGALVYVVHRFFVGRFRAGYVSRRILFQAAAGFPLPYVLLWSVPVCLPWLVLHLSFAVLWGWNLPRLAMWLLYGSQGLCVSCGLGLAVVGIRNNLRVLSRIPATSCGL